MYRIICFKYETSMSRGIDAGGIDPGGIDVIVRSYAQDNTLGMPRVSPLHRAFIFFHLQLYQA